MVSSPDLMPREHYPLLREFLPGQDITHFQTLFPDEPSINNVFQNGVTLKSPAGTPFCVQLHWKGDKDKKITTLFIDIYLPHGSFLKKGALKRCIIFRKSDSIFISNEFKASDPPVSSCKPECEAMNDSQYIFTVNQIKTCFSQLFENVTLSQEASLKIEKCYIQAIEELVKESYPELDPDQNIPIPFRTKVFASPITPFALFGFAAVITAVTFLDLIFMVENLVRSYFFPKRVVCPHIIEKTSLEIDHINRWATRL